MKSYRKKRAEIRASMEPDPWESRSLAWRRRRVSEFQAALSPHLLGLNDNEVAERELRALLFHERMETARHGDLKRAVKTIRKHLDAIATTDGAYLVLQEMFARRHAPGRDNELLQPVIECAFMLQMWQPHGVKTVLDLFENEAAAEIDTFIDQGNTKWAGVWVIDALVALWERQNGKPWTSKTVKWEGARSRGTFLRTGFDFMSRAFEVDGTVESAFKRWVSFREARKVV